MATELEERQKKNSGRLESPETRQTNKSYNFCELYSVTWGNIIEASVCREVAQLREMNNNCCV